MNFSSVDASELPLVKPFPPSTAFASGIPSAFVVTVCASKVAGALLLSVSISCEYCCYFCRLRSWMPIQFLQLLEVMGSITAVVGTRVLKAYLAAGKTKIIVTTTTG